MQMINNISTCIAATKRSNLAGNEDNLCKWTSLLPPMTSDNQEDNNILTKASAPEKKWALFYVGSSYQSQEVERIDHLIQTQWNEDSPWNSKFPLRTENTHNLVSSMAVLTSELLYCLHCNIGKPTKMYHSVSYFPSDSSNYFVYSTDLNTASNRWDQLPLSSSTTTQYTEYVSSLMLDVSGILDANYSGNGSSIPNAVLTRYGLTFSNSSYNSVNVYTSIQNHTPVFCNIQGHNYNYTITSNQISLIDGFLETESWTSQDYYANYTANYRGAYKVFDSEAEFRAYVGNSYQVGTLWSIRTGYTTSEYILLAHDDSYFSINSMPSNTTNTNNLTLQSTIVYNIH